MWLRMLIEIHVTERRTPLHQNFVASFLSQEGIMVCLFLRNGLSVWCYYKMLRATPFLLPLKNVFRHSPVVALRRKTLTLNLNFEVDIHLSDSLRTYFAGNKTVLFILKIHKDTPIMLCFLFNFFSMRFINSTLACQCKQFSTQFNPTTTASNS